MKTFKEFQEETVEISPRKFVGAVTNMLVNKIPNGNKKILKITNLVISNFLN